jgi:hypothetical protein
MRGSLEHPLSGSRALSTRRLTPASVQRSHTSRIGTVHLSSPLTLSRRSVCLARLREAQTNAGASPWVTGYQKASPLSFLSDWLRLASGRNMEQLSPTTSSHSRRLVN